MSLTKQNFMEFVEPMANLVQVQVDLPRFTESAHDAIIIVDKVVYRVHDKFQIRDISGGALGGLMPWGKFIYVLILEPVDLKDTDLTTRPEEVEEVVPAGPVFAPISVHGDV